MVHLKMDFEERIITRMQKQYIQKIDMELSPLGFGLMRLPMVNGRFTHDAYKMIFIAMEAGVNYYDTAYRYLNGHSEDFVHDALVKKYPRETFYIADKLPVWECKNKDDMEKIFQMQLEKLGTNYIDFYLLHALHKSRWHNIYNQGVLDFLEEKKKTGKIRKVGFSLHDNTKTLINIEKTYDWDFIQLQINYYDWTVQHADRSYEYLAKKGIPCIVMEPLGGGRLSKLPEKAEKLLKKVHPTATASSWGIRFTASLPNVAVTLSGMSTLDQMQANISSFSPLVPISNDEQKILNEVVQIIGSYNTIPCTACEYCVNDCPKGVDIPQIFQRYNDSKMFDSIIHFEDDYLGFISDKSRGDACINCGKCLQKCPQGIDIPKQLNDIHDMVIRNLFGLDEEGLKSIFDNKEEFLLICFGAGQRGQLLQEYLYKKKIQLNYYCDNSKQLWGEKINGIPIIGTTELREITKHKHVNMIITSNSYTEIKKQLESLNIPNLFIR